MGSIDLTSFQFLYMYLMSSTGTITKERATTRAEIWLVITLGELKSRLLEFMHALKANVM